MERGTTSWHATARVLTPSVVRKASGKACTLTDLLFDPHRPSTQNRDSSLLLFVALPSMSLFFLVLSSLPWSRSIFPSPLLPVVFWPRRFVHSASVYRLKLPGPRTNASREYLRFVRTRGVHAGNRRRRRTVVTRRVWLYNVINAHTTRSERSRLLLPPFYRVPRH